MQWRRIISMGGTAAALAVVAPGGAGSLAAAQMGEGVQGAPADPAAVFAARSPGARAPGAIATSKPHLVAAPTERVLSPVLDRPTAAAAGIGSPQANAVERVLSGMPNAFSPASSPGPQALPIPGIPGTPGGLIPPPGGSGGDRPLPPALPTIAAPVPEPATWGLMIAGLALVGIPLRRRRQSALRA